MDDIIDVVEGNRKYCPALYVRGAIVTVANDVVVVDDVVDDDDDDDVVDDDIIDERSGGAILQYCSSGLR